MSKHVVPEFRKQNTGKQKNVRIEKHSKRKRKTFKDQKSTWCSKSIRHLLV